MLTKATMIIIGGKEGIQKKFAGKATSENVPKFDAMTGAVTRIATAVTQRESIVML